MPVAVAAGGRPRPSSLYTFRRPCRRLGSALSECRGTREFAEFERIPTAVSVRPAHILSLLCLPIPPSSRLGPDCALRRLGQSAPPAKNATVLPSSPKPWLPVPRSRLTALLAESALTSVELLIAPPGYGKTTVLREYAGGDPDVALVALHEDTDLESFVREVIAAAVPSALRSVGALFESPDDRSVEDRAADWLVSRLHAFGGTVIVDDFQRASADEAVARVLAATIAATHGRVRWIVSSREAPRFPMGSWIARGWMGLPITGEDLAFTLDEAEALAASLDIAVDAGRARLDRRGYAGLADRRADRAGLTGAQTRSGSRRACKRAKRFSRYCAMRSGSRSTSRCARSSAPPP